MDKTSVLVEFSVYKQSVFSPALVTEALALQPSEAYVMGDSIPNRGQRRRVDTAWSISTGYQESDDINHQLSSILKLLEGKTEKLVELKQTMGVHLLFMIVVRVENGEVPGIYLEEDFIHFASSIGAEIGFDVLLYSLAPDFELS